MKLWRRQWPWITIAVMLLVAIYVWVKVMHFDGNADRLLALVSAAASIVAAVFAVQASISQAAAPDLVMEFDDPPGDRNNVTLLLNDKDAVLLPTLIRNEGNATADRCHIELQFPIGVRVETRARMSQPPGGLWREHAPNLIPYPGDPTITSGWIHSDIWPRSRISLGEENKIWIYPEDRDTVEIHWEIQTSRSTRQGTVTVRVKRQAVNLPSQAADVS